jgi:hypothetical protein
MTLQFYEDERAMFNAQFGGRRRRFWQRWLRRKSKGGWLYPRKRVGL